MSRIPCIEARFFSANEGRIELETRFMQHLRKLRCRKIPPDLLAPPDEVDAPDKVSDPDLMGIVRFGNDDESRIKRRVKRILECRKNAWLAMALGKERLEPCHLRVRQPEKIAHPSLRSLNCHQDGRNPDCLCIRPTAWVGGKFGRQMPRIAAQARAGRFADDVRLLTDADLDPVELHNARLLHGVRVGDPVADEAAARVLAEMTGMASLSDLTAMTGCGAGGFRALLQLIRWGNCAPSTSNVLPRPLWPTRGATSDAYA